MPIRWTKTNKYCNKKFTIDGIEFASKKEANRYTELKLLEKTGKIKDLELQKPYELIPAQYEESTEIYTKGAHKGKPKPGRQIERAVIYVADFVYTDCATGKQVVEDIKGYTASNGAAYAKFIIKRKLMLWRYGIKIKEI